MAKFLFLTIGFKVIPKSSKIISLIYNSKGGLSFFSSTSGTQLFSYLYYQAVDQALMNVLVLPTFAFLYQLKNSTKLSSLELFPGNGIQYARSAGSFAKLLKLDWVMHTALLKLPSGVQKTFSIYSYTNIGTSSRNDKKTLKTPKSGVYRNLGIGISVRGVAKNPVDHPHGGRTKSIKYPRTPWGKTTKYK